MAKQESVLLKARPGKEAIALGDKLEKLAAAIRLGEDVSDSDEQEHARLEQLARSKKRFLDTIRCEQYSSSKAVRAWAEERLGSLEIETQVHMATLESQGEARLSRHANTRLVKLADDVTLLACFSRQIESAQVKSRPTLYGQEFSLSLRGPCPSSIMRRLEDKGLGLILSETVKEPSLKSWLNADADSLELRAVILAPESQIGMGAVEG